MDLPFEILQNIFNNVEKIDKLNSITVCKNWYIPVVESLYSKVQINSSRSFRAFLYRIAHDEFNVGKKVRVLKLYPEDDYNNNSRSITFTEFDILARYCTELEELYFNNTKFWKYLNLLDWQYTWTRLSRIPPANQGNESFSVYLKIGSRLGHLEICTSVLNNDLKNLLSQTNQLKTLILNRFTLDPINVDMINTIHTKSPYLQSICFKTHLDEFSQQELTPSSLLPITCLKSLACYIYSSNSAWFSIIKSYYSNIPSLSLRLLDQTNLRRRRSLFIADFLNRLSTERNQTTGHEGANEYTEQIMQLIQYTNIQFIHVIFQFSYSIAHLKHLLHHLVHDHVKLGQTRISFDFTYFDDCPSIENIIRCSLPYPLEKNLYLTVHKEHQGMHYAIKYRSSIPFTFKNNEVLLFHHLFGTFLNQVTELKLTRRILYLVEKKYIIYLDQLLSLFPQLNKLYVSSEYEYENNKNNSRVEFSISAIGFTKKYHLNLNQLTIKDVKIHPNIFTFIFQFCKNLTELNIYHCQLHEETQLALEYFCIEHDILLYVK